MKFLPLAIALSATPSITVSQHGYDGTTTTTGTVQAWNYTAGHMTLEWTPAQDGVFRNGFEVAR